MGYSMESEDLENMDSVYAFSKTMVDSLLTAKDLADETQRKVILKRDELYARQEKREKVDLVLPQYAGQRAGMVVDRRMIEAGEQLVYPSMYTPSKGKGPPIREPEVEEVKVLDGFTPFM